MELAGVARQSFFDVGGRREECEPYVRITEYGVERRKKAEGCKLELTRRCSVSHDTGCGFPTKRVRKLAKQFS